MYKIIKTIKINEKKHNYSSSISRFWKVGSCYDKGTLQEMKDALLYLRSLMRYLNYENIFLDANDVPCETKRKDTKKLSVKVDRPNVFGLPVTLEYSIVKD